MGVGDCYTLSGEKKADKENEEKKKKKPLRGTRLRLLSGF